MLVWPERAFGAAGRRLHIEAIDGARAGARAAEAHNLTAALHMLVETVFWFHPMVWWMERQMVKEREQACDEAVVYPPVRKRRVRMGHPATLRCATKQRMRRFAEALLKTCRFCVGVSAGVAWPGRDGRGLEEAGGGDCDRAGAAANELGEEAFCNLAAATAGVVATPVVLGQAKAARRMMLAAIEAAPRPVQAAAKAMIPVAGSAFPGHDDVGS